METLEGEIWDAGLIDLKPGALKHSLTREEDADLVHLKPRMLKLAPSYFEYFSTLKVLNLSHTNIQSLPPSVSKLSLLVRLTLQECSMLMELPPEIGTLKNLMIFDLEGTEIMYLPKEMGKLENLKCLRVSLCVHADEYIHTNGIENIIPRMTLLKLSKLEELSICVNPDAKWWKVEVLEAILQKLDLLPHLKTLELYLPTAIELRYILQLPIYSSLWDFRLKIGHSEQHTSFLPTELMERFEKLERCFKLENGEGSTYDIKKLIRHANSLLVCRHWTLEKLSTFDLSRLKHCLLAECYEMRTIVDANELYVDRAFESLQYLSVHFMKKLQSIWKGPIAKDSFSCLKVLALHTCPELTTVFTEDMLDKFHSLTDLIVEDCPKVNSLVIRGSTHMSHERFLPKLRRIVLIDLPELVSISSGVCFVTRLDTLLIFNCLKLDYLSPNEISFNVKEIKGETEWWAAIKKPRFAYTGAFAPLIRDGDLMNRLAEATNSLKQFHKLQSRGEASTLFSYKADEHLNLGMFMQHLKYQKPPVSFSQYNSCHVIEFLKDLDKYGDIRVHMQGCLLFGHPYPAATCFCPLTVAWATLEAFITRLHAAYLEHWLLQYNRYVAIDIQSYLKKVWLSQEKALGIPSKNFPIPSIIYLSDFGRSPTEGKDDAEEPFNWMRHKQTPEFLQATARFISNREYMQVAGWGIETSTKQPMPIVEGLSRTGQKQPTRHTAHGTGA